MKTLIKNIFAILPLLFIASCDLTLIPEDTVTPSAYFKSETDLQLWTNQFYSILDTPDNAGGVNADDMVDKTMGEVISGTRLASEDIDGANEWNWKLLRKVNYLLQNSSNCSDLSVRQHYEGVAYFFRAYLYYQKVMRFGDLPWYNQVLKSTDEELLKKPREDREIVMDSIMVDFDRAIKMLPSTKDVARVTKWTALAMKSRVALFEGTWRKYRGLSDADKFLTSAAEAARTFIDESGYTLYSEGPTPYRDLFNSDDAKSTEIILARIYNFETLNLSHGVQFNIRNGAQGFTRRFMNHYLMADGTRYTDKAGHDTLFYTEEVKNRDPRMVQTVLCPGYIIKDGKSVTPNDMTSMTGYEPIKYVSTEAHSGASKGTSDFSIIRAAEVYLNYAEAKAELGTLTQEDINVSVNKIRTRAKMPALDLATSNASPDAFLSFLLS
jgi:hypothetical protein